MSGGTNLFGCTHNSVSNRPRFRQAAIHPVIIGFMEFQRSSGVLLHISSLPSYGGIGDLGPAAHEFLGFLARAKQHVWQVLPLCPTGYGNSPYAGSSAFAGNPSLISLEFLADWGWIDGARIAGLAGRSGTVDFDEVARGSCRCSRRLRGIFLIAGRSRRNLKTIGPILRISASMRLHGSTTMHFTPCCAVCIKPARGRSGRSRCGGAIRRRWPG